MLEKEKKMIKSYLKKIKILENISLQLIYKDEKKLLVIKKNLESKYVLIPSFIKLIKEDKFLISELLINEKENLENYFLTNIMIETGIKKIGVSSKKKLILKGLGYRMTFANDSKRIDFKLGFSHLKRLEIPTKIKIKFRKNIINVESLDKNLLGNYISKIRCLREPDSYKGKGFWYKYEKEKLKEIKKK